MDLFMSIVLFTLLHLCSTQNGLSIQRSTRLDVEENMNLSGKAGQIVYKPYTYRDHRVQQHNYYGQPQQHPYYGYQQQQQTYYYQQQQPTYYYPTYSYPSGGFGGGGGIFGFCLLCFGIGK